MLSAHQEWSCWAGGAGLVTHGERSQAGLRAAAGHETAPSKARGTNCSHPTAAPETPRSSHRENLSLLPPPPHAAGKPGWGENRHGCAPWCPLSRAWSCPLALTEGCPLSVTRCCGLSLGFPGSTSPYSSLCLEEGFHEPCPTPCGCFWADGAAEQELWMTEACPAGLAAPGCREPRGTCTAPRRVRKPDASPLPMWRRREEGPKTCPFTLSAAENTEGNVLEPFPPAQEASLSRSHPRSPPVTPLLWGGGCPAPAGR